MDQQSSKGSFLKTDGGKSKPNAIEIPSINLPKGGGALKGIDEKFAVNAVNGSASFSIPLPFTAARGASPSLSLAYSSGAGNGIFGLGWSLSLPSIKRKTDKELPTYIDSIDSDTFLFSEAEDLVPEFQKEVDGSFSTDENGEYILLEQNSTDNVFTIRFYRPRIEGLFARIERWTEKTTGISKWRIISKDNVTSLFGWTSNAVISNPDPSKSNEIFQWLPEFVYDDKGNCSQYIYKKEDKLGFNQTLLHHKNRSKNGEITYTNAYLEKIIYGNKTPYLTFGTAFPPSNNYLFETIFDYGEYDSNAPFSMVKNWDFRPDAFSDYKAGFEIRTTRLCKRVLLFHHFTGEEEYDGLVKSVHFEYDISTQQNFTFLKSFCIQGHILKSDGTYSSKSMPKTEFLYQKHEWNCEVKSISPESLIHAPSGLGTTNLQFTDLFNEGLSGMLLEKNNAWYYKHNLGNGNFEQAKLISPKPSFSGEGSRFQLSDLEANGTKQFVNMNSHPSGYFELDDQQEWTRFNHFENMPNIDFNDSNIRMLDLNGDGLPELVITEENAFSWYESDGKKGFLAAQKTASFLDEEQGPKLVFSEQTQTIFLADMSGNGMTDLVRIRNGEVCYWPNMGYGKFGAKVSMDNSPVFDHPEAFNPTLLRISDIDASGTADLIYLGRNKVTCWLNLSGNSFSSMPFEISSFPQIDNLAQITTTDLLGNGLSCIVWSSNLPNDQSAPLRYIDLMNSKKPHTMVFYKNNMGKEVSMEYRSSTEFYIEDKLAGKPWVTRLHFPVYCISKTETRDRISGMHYVSSYKYHHGYFDHAEREFRGFGMIEQTDTEDFEHWIKGNTATVVEANLCQEPLVSKTWVHTGAFLSREKILSQFATEYWYEERIRQGFETVHHELALADARLITAQGMPPEVLANLSTQEWQEALRACKGMTLRTEVFACDAPALNPSEEELKRELTPYSVETGNCVIELLQPKGKNKHAVFVVKQCEAISYSYERNPEDPRIAHQLNVKLDEYGNVLESAAIVYPRLLADLTLPLETRQAQAKTIMTYSQNRFTNDVTGDHTHRLRLPSEVKTVELKGIPKVGMYYSLSDFENVLNTATSVHYHQVDQEPVAGTTQQRLIEHVRTNYSKNDLSGPLALHQLESHAFAFESYQLAYTPELLTDLFGPINLPTSKITDALMLEGKYCHSIDENNQADSNWWVRSGTMQLISGVETVLDAANRFFSPMAYTDPFGASTKVSYYGSYFLFVQETEDTLGNKAGVDQFNFRTLSPVRMRDINNNLSEAIADELGLVKAIAVLGKGNEADNLTGITEFTSDAEETLILELFNASNTQTLITKGKALLQGATTRFIYNYETYQTTGKPVVVASIAREEHVQQNNDSPIQFSFEYTNGLGKTILKKSQAEPGKAKKVTVHPDNTYSLTTEDTAASNPKQLRWIGNGRTILNNKGNAVKQYEPYFSTTHTYEDYKELVETGVTPLLYYDALSRLIKTELPNKTFSKVEFNSWKQISYDTNDTILESDWYLNRSNNLIDAELLEAGKNPMYEKAAADKAAKHANTPGQLHLDTLGRPVLSIDHNKNIQTEADEFYRTKVFLDSEGNLRKVLDAREITENLNKGNAVMQYKYDMLGNMIYQTSMDAGQRWLLLNILGNPLRTWDERNHTFEYHYDVLHRPTHSLVKGGDGQSALNHVFERIFYGESLLLPDRSNEAAVQANNVLGKGIKHYDTGGVILTPAFDFKGLALSTTRKLFKNYKTVVNWIDANLELDLEDDPAISDGFTFSSETDALGRITLQTAPDGTIITPSYNEAGLLNAESAIHPGNNETIVYIKDIDYNEKGQRTKITYGNDVTTKFYFDPETFAVRRIESKRLNNDPLQDWYYTFDPVGNITHIEDKNIPTAFFDNVKVTGLSEYTYDAIYRLVDAKGRENNAALTFDTKDNWNDAPYMRQHANGDQMSVRDYTQYYQYDEVGNIKQMRHVAPGNTWTRDYAYETTTNRLLRTEIGAQSYQYTHHPQHGFITVMPHLDDLVWNFKEELVKSIKQRVNPGNGTAETTYYQYDGQGQRLRKITDNSAVEGATPTKKEERIYISGYELYRKLSGNYIGLERVSISLMDEGHRFVTIETRNGVEDGTEQHLQRYQLHNLIGSASLELDAFAAVISYEEYHPFGTTAYQANNASIKATAKRYRYTGMERDEETGLSYHSARYYMPWLGRWLSRDPIGIGDGVNVFSYCLNNPVNKTDVNGMQSMVVTEMQLQSMSPDVVQRLIAAAGGHTGRCYENPTMEQRRADVAMLRNILIRANLYDMSSVPFTIVPPRMVEDHTPVLMADSRGNGYIGPRYVVERQVGQANFGYQMEVGNNIRGGLFGTAGYLIGGDQGSYVGAAVDGVVLAAGMAAGQRATNSNMPSSRPSGRPVAAEVRPQRPARASTPPPPPRPPSPPPSPPRPPSAPLRAIFPRTAAANDNATPPTPVEVPLAATGTDSRAPDLRPRAGTHRPGQRVGNSQQIQRRGQGDDERGGTQQVMPNQARLQGGEGPKVPLDVGFNHNLQQFLADYRLSSLADTGRTFRNFSAWVKKHPDGHTHGTVEEIRGWMNDWHESSESHLRRPRR